MYLLAYDVLRHTDVQGDCVNFRDSVGPIGPIELASARWELANR